MITFITYYKKAAIEYWKEYELEKVLKEPKEYKTFGDFTHHIETQTYKITFQDISTAYIDRLCEEKVNFIYFKFIIKIFLPKRKRRALITSILCIGKQFLIKKIWRM